jgi:uncharacterized protein involved in exopolysaccharide biosynthesis
MNDPEPEILVSFSDLLLICKSAKRKILFGALFFACLSLFYTLTKPIEYEAYATFKEKNRSHSGINTNNFTSMLFSSNHSDGNEATSMMKSRYILERVISKLGLQTAISYNQLSFNTLASIRDNLIVEHASLRNRSGRILPDIKRNIFVRNVTYLGEKSLSLKLHFISEERFQYSGDDKISGQGTIGVPIIIPQVSFTIVREGKRSLTSQECNLTFEPMRNVSLGLVNGIKLGTHKDDKNLLTLKYAHRDRKIAADIVNTIMSTYQEYLKEEQTHVLNEQVKYLQARHQNMQTDLQKMMMGHADTLSSDVAITGFPDSNKAMDFFAGRQAEYSKELLAIDLEIKRLQKAHEGGSAYYERYTLDAPSVINPILSEIRRLKQQSHSIDLALKKAVNANPSILIENENSVQASLEIPKIQHHEFQGINLETAQDLYVDYSKQLNTLESDILQQYFILEQMQKEEFEISSLSTILTDSVSKEMIGKASGLLLSLRDQHNRSAKELERLKNELAIQKGFLALHLQQTLQLLQLKENLWREKIESILSTTLNLIQKEISILQEQMTAYIKTRIDNLHQERSVIEQHQQLLHLEMAKLPSKWVSERLIDQQMDMNKKMVEEITRLVENKNISSNLELVQSAPVDTALAAIQPRPPRILFFMLLSAFLGAFLTLGASVVQAMVNGVKATEDNLKLAQQYVVGTFSATYKQGIKKPLLDQDLETLRRIIVFMKSINARTVNDSGEKFRGSVLTLIGEGLDYSEDIASLLFKKGLRVLLLPVSFEQANTEKAGLLQYLEGKVDQPTITKDKEYDFIVPGGVCRYANEYIGSHRFLTLVEELQQHYDWVLISNHATPDSAETEHLLHLFNDAVITVTDQSWNDLKSCMDTSGQQHRAFVLT